MRNGPNHRAAAEARCRTGLGCSAAFSLASASRWASLLLATLGGLFISLHDARSQQVWLAARSPNTHPHGVSDWDSLFRPTNEWAAVASRINVFGITVGYVLQAPDQELVAVAGDLGRRHIDISIGLQSIARTSSDACGNQEGYGTEPEHARAADKLHRLGIALHYVTLDEPLWFGHLSTDPVSCRFTLEELAKRVGASVNKYVAVFPDLTLGDIEPIPGLILRPDWQASTRTFYNALKLRTGKDVTFLHTDVAWRVPGYAAALATVQTFAHDMKLEFGVFYNGDGRDHGDTAWVSAAVGHFEKLESQPGFRPDDALFASWDNYPTHVLPETSDGTLGHVVASYARDRAFFSLTRTPDTIRGQLLTNAGRPVAAASVVVSQKGLTQPIVPHIATGSVPANAHAAIIGIRVNTECYCQGNNDISLGEITYAEQATGLAGAYSLAKEAERQAARPSNDARPTLQLLGDRGIGHIAVAADQRYGVNSAKFAVTPGASFRFEVPVGSPSATGLYGSISLIWLDQDGKGISRTIVTLGSDEEASRVATVRTDQNGEFQVAAPRIIGSRLQVTFTGSTDLRASEAEVN